MAPGTRGEYSLVEDKDIDSSHSLPPPTTQRHGGRSILTGSTRLSKNSLLAISMLALSSMTGFGGYLLGTRSEAYSKSEKSEETLLHLNTIPVTFEYDERFVQPPSNASDALWDSLFPDNGGFFGHPSLEQNPVEFAVYHQLHCLYGLRNALWATRNNGDASHSDAHSEDHDHYSHAGGISEYHVAHCIDYIRQSLMCVADTTIEVAVKAPGGRAGVRGWGTEHVCRDYGQVGEWTAEWQSYQ